MHDDEAGHSRQLDLTHSFFCWRVSTEQSNRCQYFKEIISCLNGLTALQHLNSRSAGRALNNRIAGLGFKAYGLEALCRAGQFLLEGDVGSVSLSNTGTGTAYVSSVSQSASLAIGGVGNVFIQAANRESNAIRPQHGCERDCICRAQLRLQ